MKRYAIVFICILLITSLAVTWCGYAIRTQLLEPMGLERKESTIALPFVLMADEMLQFQIRRGWETLSSPPIQIESTEPSTSELPLQTEPSVDETAPSESEPTDTLPLETEPTETEPPETEPVYTPVDESWFDDALFIGDSRTYGLKAMGRLGQADYFCAGSLTVFSAMTNSLSDRNFYTTNLEGLLKSKTYGKIYIHLGLNELAGGADMVMEGYLALVDMIIEYQPDAVIIIQACMTMKEWMGQKPEFAIEKFRELNRQLEELAKSDPVRFRFCDTNTWAAGEDGYIRSEIACDGCHLYGMYYTEWAQFILEDAGWYGIP